MWYVLIAYFILIVFAIYRIESNFKEDRKRNLPAQETKKDPYENFRDPVTGLLGGNKWKKKE